MRSVNRHMKAPCNIAHSRPQKLTLATFLNLDMAGCGALSKNSREDRRHVLHDHDRDRKVCRQFGKSSANAFGPPVDVPIARRRYLLVAPFARSVVLVFPGRGADTVPPIEGLAAGDGRLTDAGTGTAGRVRIPAVRNRRFPKALIFGTSSCRIASTAERAPRIVDGLVT